MIPVTVSDALLDQLTEQAKASPRLRMNYDLRNSPEDGSQRMLNAIELTPGGPSFLVNVPAGQWHTVRALGSSSVLLEMKDGKYEPLGPEDILSL